MDYQFRNEALKTAAFTHRSSGHPINNQRLEFLGDRVIGLVVAELLYTRFPGESEGELARRHAGLVCRDTLVAIAISLDLGAALILSPSEETEGRTTPSNLEDACEALIGAIYLDGGYDAAKEVVIDLWTPLLQAHMDPPKDAKTSLQEWLQARSAPLPVYTELSRKGPDHAPYFLMEAEGAGKKATGEGNSKRVAEQVAALALLELLSRT